MLKAGNDESGVTRSGNAADGGVVPDPDPDSDAEPEAVAAIESAPLDEPEPLHPARLKVNETDKASSFVRRRDCFACIWFLLAFDGLAVWKNQISTFQFPENNIPIGNFWRLFKLFYRK